MVEKRIATIVTVTGADDSIDPRDLVPLAVEFPFAEFGILLSKKQQGTKRFPSKDWLEELYLLWYDGKLPLSGHMCGEWVRDLCVGKPTFFKEFGYTWPMFKRIQLNFHAEHHPFDYRMLAGLIRRSFGNIPVIFQMDGVNEKVFSAMCDGSSGITAQPLFDSSGGAGLLPNKWPKQLVNRFCGYAGGLSPDNLAEEMEKISSVAPGPIWIDAETLLRSENDMVFDLEKVCRFLEAAKPWVYRA
jgi:hypothetical protein